MAKIKTRLKVGLHILSYAIANAMSVISYETEVQTAKPNPTKPYKPRRIKQDPIHKMARMLYRMKVRNPAFVRKQKLRQKLYRRKNKLLLQRRAEFVNKARDRMGLDDKD